jgi:hypothetical protein
MFFNSASDGFCAITLEMAALQLLFRWLLFELRCGSLFYSCASDGFYTIALEIVVLQLLFRWFLFELRCGSFYNCASDVCYRSTTALRVVVSFVSLVKLRNILLK